MRIPFRRSRTVSGFDITPMIDVVFNLVIFFLIASQFARNEGSEPVALPIASQSTQSEDDPHRLIVTVLPDGTLSVGRQAIKIEGIKAVIEERAGEDRESFAVHVRADRAAPYGSVEPVLEACAALGITKVGFKVMHP